MNTALDNAKWIWHNDYHTVNIYLNFFDKLVAKKGKKYTMYISVDSNYALYINEKFVESGQFADYPEYKVYDTLNITDYLCEGENDIRIVGYHQGKDCSTYRKEAAGLLYAVEEDGKAVLVSDESTQVCLNSCYKSEGVSMVSGQLGFGFEYDCTKTDEKIGLKNADIQEKVVSLNARPIKKLVIGPQKPAKIIAWGEIKDSGSFNTLGERVQNAYMASRYNEKKPLPLEKGYDFATQFAESEGLYVIVDLGEETSGYTDIEIDVPEECDILIAHGEHLEDMRVRAFIYGRVFTNRYHAKAGLNKFFNPLRRMGLRYLQLNIYAKSAKVHYAGIRTTEYPVSDKPFFRCSDHLHNKIYDVCINTLKQCMHEHYEDCPWREQALYAMDSRNQMLCGYYCFGEFDFAKASLRLIAKSIREDNLTELCSPARVSITIPCFCAIFVTQVYEYVMHSGNTAFAFEMIDTVKRITDEFVSRMGDKGLIKVLHEPQYWNFYEWQTGMNKGYGVKDPKDTTYDAPLNAFVSMALRSLSALCGMVDDKEGKAKYAKLHTDLNAAIDREFWDEASKSYYSYVNVESGEKTHFGQLTQALIVYCNACPYEKLDDVLNVIVNGGYYEATLSHTIFVYDALMKRPEKYAKFVMNDIADKWGYMLYNNATTFWETIDGAEAFSNAGSLCHGWSAIPIYIYFRYAAGLKVVDEGRARYKIDPVDCGLYECESLIVTPTTEIHTKATDK